MRKYESPSSIGMWSRCAQQYYWRYVEGLKMRPGYALPVGGGVHKGAEVDLTAKRDTGVLLETEAVKAATADEVQKRWQEAEEDGGIMLSDTETEQGLGVGTAIDEAVNLVEAYHTTLAPEVEPTLIEHKFTLELDGFPFGLLGYIDYLDGLAVIDLKTGKRRPDPNTSLQLVIYSLARVADGVPPLSAGFDVLLKQKTVKAERIYCDQTPGEQEFQRLFRRIEIMADAIEKEVYAPAEPGSWICSARFCGYHQHNGGPCPHGQ